MSGDAPAPLPVTARRFESRCFVQTTLQRVTSDRVRTMYRLMLLSTGDRVTDTAGRKMAKALVTGGYFDESGDGVVWLVDLAAERADVLVNWTPPPHLRVPTKGLAGGSLGPDGSLYVAAHAAVVRVDPVRAAVTGALHQQCMNDLHHVAAIGDRLFVANTGLGAVDVFEAGGAFLGSHALLPAWANARRLNGDHLTDAPPNLVPGWAGEAPEPWPTSTDSPISLPADGYYTSEPNSAPFHSLKVRDHLHVNHVQRVRERLVATCFSDGSLRDLLDFTVLARLEGQFLHDGAVYGDGLWVTTTDGNVVELCAQSFAERRRIRVFETGHYGWCRGLAVREEHIWVGMTEVRRGRVAPHRWSSQEPQGSETSVLLLDRRDGRLVGRVDLTDPARHAKIYSILPL